MRNQQSCVLIVVHGTAGHARGGSRQYLPLLPAPRGLPRLPAKHHRENSTQQVGQLQLLLPDYRVPLQLRAQLFRPACDREVTENCNVSELVSAGTWTTVATGKTTTAIVPMETTPAIPATANRRTRRRRRATNVVPRRRREEGGDGRSRFSTSKWAMNFSSQI